MSACVKQAWDAGILLYNKLEIKMLESATQFFALSKANRDFVCHYSAQKLFFT